MSRPSLFSLELIFCGVWTFAGLSNTSGQSYEWTTFAGTTGGTGFRDGLVGSAQFKGPRAVATDATGNLYLADTDNHTIRKITPSQVVSTLAGKGGKSGIQDGTGSDARFSSPGGLALDAIGNIFVADTGNHTIRRIGPTGVVTTIAGEAGVAGHNDGIGKSARLSSPAAVTLSLNGDLFVADTGNLTIRKITPDGTVSTIAGQAGTRGYVDGPAGIARFRSPKGLATDDAGTLYIADISTIRTISPDGMVTTLAGRSGLFDNVDGIGTAAGFCLPEGIAVDGSRNLYVSDTYFGTLRRIDAANGMVTTLAGNISPTAVGRIDGTGRDARFNAPRGIAIATDGNLLVADTVNHALRKVTPGGFVTTFAISPPRESGATDGTGTDARFTSPNGLCLDVSGTLYIADTGNRTIRKISPSGVVTTWAGTAGISGTTDASGPDARFTSPRAVAIGPGGVAYVSDVVVSTNGTIRKISPAGAVTTLAGASGTLAPADTLYFLGGLAVDPSGNVFAADFTSLRKITPPGVVSTFAGHKRTYTTLPTGGGFLSWDLGSPADGNGTEAYFNHPSGVARASDGNLFVTEYGGCVIRKVTPAGQATTVAGKLGTDGMQAIPGSDDGSGSAARFKNPRGIAVDPQGNRYIADSGNNTIRKMSPAGVVTTIGGLPGYAGLGEGTGDQALFNLPFGIAVNSSGTIYVADTANHRIVKGVPLAVSDLVVARPDGSHLTGGTTVELGSVAPGSAGPATNLTVLNAGNAPLAIIGVELSGVDAGSFRIDRTGLPATVPAGTSGVLRVSLSPTRQGPHAATILITSNSPGESPLEFNVTGMGNAPPVLPTYAIGTPSGQWATISFLKLLANASDPEGDAISVTAVAWPASHAGQVELLANAIRYIPPYYDFSGIETFLVTLTDVRGATATGTVVVTVQGRSASASMNPPKLKMLEGGKISVSFHGIPGRFYSIQRSPNLVNWATFGNAVAADSTGKIEFLDPSPPRPNGYYRIAIP